MGYGTSCSCAACNKRQRRGITAMSEEERDDEVTMLADTLVQGDMRSEASTQSQQEYMDDEAYGEASAWAAQLLDATLAERGGADMLAALRLHAPEWLAQETLEEAASDLLVLAAKAGRAHAIRVLVQQYGANVHYMPADRADHDGGLGAALHHATSAGHIAAMRELIALGADVNQPDGTSLLYRPLHIALLTDRASVVEALLEAGADPSLEDADGTSPLYQAATYNALDCIPVLGRAPGADAWALHPTTGLTPAEAADKAGYKVAAAALRKVQQRQRMLRSRQRGNDTGGGGGGGGGGSTAVLDEAALRAKQQQADAAMAELLAELDSKASLSGGGGSGAGKRAGTSRKGARKNRKAAATRGSSSRSSSRAPGAAEEGGTEEPTAQARGGSSTSPTRRRDGDGGGAAETILPSLAAVLYPSATTPVCVLPSTSSSTESSRCKQVAPQAEELSEQAAAAARRRGRAPATPQAAVLAPPPKPPTPPPDPLAELRAEWDGLLACLAGERYPERQAELVAEVAGRMEAVAAAGVSTKYAKKLLSKIDKAKSALAALQELMAVSIPGLPALSELATALDAVRPLQAMLPEGALAPAEEALAALEAEEAQRRAQEQALPSDLYSYDVPAAALPPPPPLTPQQQSLQVPLEPQQPQQAAQSPAQHHHHADGDELTRDQECCVCLERLRSCLCVPCGHVCCCPGCMPLVEGSGACPLCRTPLDTVLQLF